MPDPIQLDGAQGEGGGQILRSALSLAMLGGRAFEIANIRAGRAKPGLMRQHLTCVQAAAQVCSALVEGAEIGSTALRFQPGVIRGGDFTFRIGTAGSTMLVLQTVLPALLRAPQSSRVVLEGGTHTLAAPSTDFVAGAFLPLLHRMGASVRLETLRPGFFPAGGGQVRVEVDPTTLVPLQLHARETDCGIDATVLIRNLPHHIAERELEVVRKRLGNARTRVLELPGGFGPANALVVQVRHGEVNEVVVGLGAQGVSAETVANAVCDEVRAYLAHGAPVGEHLADQLLLPLLLAGGGSFVTGRPTAHLETNAAVLEAFGLARVAIAPDDSDPQRRFRVAVDRVNALAMP